MKFDFKTANQDGRVVKALDLSSNGRMSAWVRTPLLVIFFTVDVKRISYIDQLLK